MNQEAAALDVLVDVLDDDESDEDVLLLVLVDESLFVSVDDFSVLASDEDDGVADADFFESEPRLSVR
jgi:hypothetical protein